MSLNCFGSLPPMRFTSLAAYARAAASTSHTAAISASFISHTRHITW